MSVSEMYDVARKAAETMEGKCQPQTGSYRWCSWHRSQWRAGRAVCVVMEDCILLAEQAIEDADPIIRADEHRKSANANAVMGYMRSAVDEALADLRDKVKGLEVVVADMWDGTGPHYYEHTVLLSEVLALLEDKP